MPDERSGQHPDEHDEEERDWEHEHDEHDPFPGYGDALEGDPKVPRPKRDK